MIKYQTHKRNRIKKVGFHSMFTDDSLYWWSEEKKVWFTFKDSPELRKYNFSSHKDCHSLRAFRKALQQVPFGIHCTLVSKWVGYNIYGKGTLKQK